MRLPALLTNRLRLPVLASPLVAISNPDLVIAQCKAGIVGSFPALNASHSEELDVWLTRIENALSQHDSEEPGHPSAPFAVNQIVDRSNDDRLYQDMETIARHRVPIVITSQSADPDINEMVHAYGGIVFHNINTNDSARKAIKNGADGLIAIAAGAAGHVGSISPFALVQEIRQWFNGPLLLSGSIATGQSIFGATAMGADLACIGSAFIATREANAEADYKLMIVNSTATDIVYTNVVSGVYGNYLRQSLGAATVDPKNLTSRDPTSMSFDLDSARREPARDAWSAGHGIGVLRDIPTASELINRFAAEYEIARNEFLWRMEDTVEPRWAPADQ